MNNIYIYIYIYNYQIPFSFSKFRKSEVAVRGQSILRHSMQRTWLKFLQSKIAQFLLSDFRRPPGLVQCVICGSVVKHCDEGGEPPTGYWLAMPDTARYMHILGSMSASNMKSVFVLFKIVRDFHVSHYYCKIKRCKNLGYPGNKYFLRRLI